MERSNKNKKSVYYPELDGLRFLAFLLVFIHHAPLIATFGILRPIGRSLFVIHQYGWMGVDLFLCLSAFLFTKLLFVEHDAQGDINVKNFYIRRLLRIWPLYYVFTTLMILLTIYLQGWNQTVAIRGLGLAFFVDNIMAAFWGYNQMYAAGHLWTISYEEQFYAVIPWLLRRMFRMPLIRKILVVLGIFIGFTAIRALMIYLDVRYTAIWVLPIAHFEAILGGIIVGLGWLDPVARKIPSRILMLVGVIFLVLVCRLPNVTQVSWDLMLTYPLVGAGVSLIIYGVLSEDRSVLKSIFQNRRLAYLGKISFGLYVYHILAIYNAEFIAERMHILPERVIVYPLFIFLVGFVLTVSYSMISYQFLERPFLRLKEKFTTIQSRPV